MNPNQPIIIDRGFDAYASADDLRADIARVGREHCAKAAGITLAMMSMWLAGKRSMSLETRLRVAKACGRVVLVRVGRTEKRKYTRRSDVPVPK